jgi:hypothetical protein
MVIATKLCLAAFSRLAARHFSWLAGQPQYILKNNLPTFIIYEN